MYAALVGLVGIIIGVVGTAAFNRWNERVKWEREQSIRYNDQRLAVYTEILLAGGMAARADSPLNVYELEELSRALVVTDMISSAPVQEAADAYMKIIGEIGKTRGTVTWAAEGDRLLAEVQAAHRKFVEAVQQERGKEGTRRWKLPLFQRTHKTIK